MDLDLTTDMERKAGGLEEYGRKRDFQQTSEPAGDEPSSADRSPTSLRFVVQKHAARGLHYDLRLEVDGTLKSWAVPKGPSLDPDVRALAVHVEDHPLAYGSFEGTIPKGEYGGGAVMVWDRGEWFPGKPKEGAAPRGNGSMKAGAAGPTRDEMAREGLDRGRLHFTLAGERLRGGWLLARMNGKAGDGGKNWLLRKIGDDEAAGADDPPVTAAHDTSVLTGRTIEEIEAGSEAGGTDRTSPGGTLPDPPEGASKSTLPAAPKPQLPSLVDRAPTGEDWLHELKFDGYRIMARIENEGVTLLTRGGHDWSERFPTVTDAIRALAVDGTILDGEVAVLASDGTTDFQALQNQMKRDQTEAVRYFLFDMPFYRGHDLRKVPLLERKELLQKVLELRSEGPVLRYSGHIIGGGDEVARQACLHALEGVIAKKKLARYHEGRTRSWVKVKCVDRQEFVIGGWTEPSGSRTGFGALLLGWYDEGGDLRFAGRVGTGFTAASLGEIRERLEDIGTGEPAFESPPRGAAARGVHWVAPTLVAEVAFRGWTEGGRLRHPSFQGLRVDKPPTKVGREQTQSGSRSMNRIAGVALSNPDRVLYPEQGVTKRDLARYYETVEEWILPHLEDRPLSLVRCPGGRGEKCFYQKHLTEGLPEPVRGIEVGDEDEPSLYVAVDDLPGLVTLVQFGVMELHPWGSREDRLDRPDRIVFDLDPGEGVQWRLVTEAAHSLRGRLGDLGLESYLRTTGGKGLHLMVPIARRSDWDDVKGFARDIARAMEREEPERYVSTARKAKRKGKIFVDYLRNGRGATAIASYSTRARPGAPVATPLRWEELSRLPGPDRYTVLNIPARLGALGSDPWEGLFQNRQVLTRSMREAAPLLRQRSSQAPSPGSRSHSGG
ncbi:MAG: DNA ligase D [Gemmatimonadota bacterium]